MKTMRSFVLVAAALALCGTAQATEGLRHLVGQEAMDHVGNPKARFTGGGYALLHASKDERTKAGAIVGYEQPLSKKISLLVDWFSGDNRFGYVSPGLSFVTSKKSALTTGYTIANHGSGKNALFAYYGFQF